MQTGTLGALVKIIHCCCMFCLYVIQNNPSAGGEKMQQKLSESEFHP